jgi:diaminopimelate epimerase
MTEQAFLRFHKMHGAGNDFVVVDLRHGQNLPFRETLQAMANRHTGIGFDQLLTIEPSRNDECIARYRIFNADSSPAQQCGNGARCVAAWLKKHDALTQVQFLLESPAGNIAVQCLENERYALNMGVPEFMPQLIPFRTKTSGDAYQFDIDGSVVEFSVVSMGNPHAVIEVQNVEIAEVLRIGKAMQARVEFPESVNVGFVEIISPHHIKLRVYERGSGETLACGSGACAAVAALIQRGKISSPVQVSLPGGDLEIEWQGANTPIRMSGPAAFVYEGIYQS